MNTILYKRNPKTIFYEFDTEAYILDEKNDEIITLNDSGKLLWSKLKSPVTLATLVEHFRSRYIAPQNEIRADIHKALQNLLKRGIVIEVSKVK